MEGETESRGVLKKGERLGEEETGLRKEKERAQRRAKSPKGGQEKRISP